MRRLLPALLAALALVGSACAGEDGAATADAALAEANAAGRDAATARVEAQAASGEAEAALTAAGAARAAADLAHLTAEENREAVAAAEAVASDVAEAAAVADEENREAVAALEAALEAAQRAADEAREQLAAARSEADTAREAAKAAQDEADAQAAAAAEPAEAGPEPVSEPAEGPEPAYEPPAPDPTLLSVDPAVRIGTLDNGLTYYLRNNEKPGTNLALRLAVAAGSLHEAEAGLGVAHFLEHMMFNGTEEYPRNDIIDALRGLGVEFGPDFNAYTSYDATVYELDVVTNQPGVVETAFRILSQWAHAATISESDVVEERGVVRDELRLRYETGGGIVLGVFDDVYVEGTPYEGRRAIGTPESIATMTPEVLRDFYETWYVPSNMAVVAVGDLSLDELETLVTEHFGAIPPGEAPPAPDTFSPFSPEAVYAVATSPSQGYPYISLDIKIPSWPRGTVGGERLELMETLISLMLDARLKDAYEQGLLSQLDPAKMDVYDYTDGIRFYGTNLRAHDLAAALGDYWSLVLSIEAAGFSEADLRRAAEVVRTESAFALRSAATRQDHEYAESYVEHFLAGDDIGTVSDSADRVNALLDGIQPSELSDYFRWIMRTSGPLLIAVGAETADVPTTDEMRAAIEGAVPGEVPERTAEVTVLMDAPEPVEPTSEGAVEAIGGAYEWSFANGATVVFVPSGISEAQVDLRAISQGGWSAMQPGDRPLAGRLATRAVGLSGLAGYTPSQVQRLLDDHNVEVVPFIEETEEGFTGTAADDGIETMFQMLHLLVAAPQLDDQAFAEAVQLGETILALAHADPDWQSWIAYIETRESDAVEWFSPVASQEALDALTPESLLDRYLARLGDVDDLIVAVAGDVGRDTVELMARTYVGTLPAGEPDTFVDRRSPEPAGVWRRYVVMGPDEQNTGVDIYYEAERPVDVELEVTAQALSTILGARFTAEIREQLGATYSAGITVTPHLAPQPGVTARIAASGDPEYVERIHRTIIAILADLVQNGPTPDEWGEASAVLNSEYTHMGNADHLDAILRRAHAPDDELTTPARLFEELAALEAADVQALAAELFRVDQHIDIVRVLG